MDWETLRQTHDRLAQTAANIYLQHQSIEPQLIIMPAGDIERMVFVAPKIVSSMYESEAGKNRLAGLIRSLMNPRSDIAKLVEQQYGFIPEVAVQIHEAVRYALDPRTGEKIEGRTEDCLLVVMHTAVGSIPVMHPIAQHPHPHVVPAPFPGPEIMEQFKGRFAIQDNGLRGTDMPMSTPQATHEDGEPAESEPACRFH